MTMNTNIAIFIDFWSFWAATHISRANCAAIASDKQDNLHMKFSALNADFNGLSRDPGIP